MIRTEVIAAGRTHGYLAHADQPVGGVLVLPTITAVDPPMQEQARRLAQEGLTALVWDPYPGQPLPAMQQEAATRAATLNDAAAIEDMSACCDYLRRKLGLKSVGTIGFCLGGRYAVLLAAQDPRIAACVPFYPSIREPMKPNETHDAVAEAAQIACPVHLVHGTGDRVFTNGVFAKLRAALESRNAATTVQVHPGAVHSFMRAELQSDPANAAATRLSWPQAVGFLRAALG